MPKDNSVGVVGPPPPDDEIPRNEAIAVGDRVRQVRSPERAYVVVEVYQPRCKAQVEGGEQVVEFLTRALQKVDD